MTKNGFDDIDNLIKSYAESEEELGRIKSIYENLEQVVLQDSMRDAESQATKVCNKTSSSMSFSSKTSKPRSYTSSFNNSLKEERLSVSRAVERRIHQIENFNNVLRQPRVSNEKLLFLQSLKNNR